METQPFDSVFRRAVEGSDPYEQQAEEAMDRVWERSRPKHRLITFPPVLHWLAAACILLLIGTTVLSYLLIREKNQLKALSSMVVLYSDSLAGNRVSKQQESPQVLTVSPKNHDTVFLERKVLVYQPVTITERKTDTVYIDRVSYVEKECPEQIAFRQETDRQAVVAPPALQGNGKEILISTKDTRKPEKKSKFIFWPGGNGNRAGDDQGSITLNF